MLFYCRPRIWHGLKNRILRIFNTTPKMALKLKFEEKKFYASSRTLKMMILQRGFGWGYVEDFLSNRLDFSYPTCRFFISYFKIFHILLQTFHTLPSDFSHPTCRLVPSYFKIFPILPSDFSYPTFRLFTSCLPEDFSCSTCKLFISCLKICILPADFSYPTCRLFISYLQTCHILPA